MKKYFILSVFGFVWCASWFVTAGDAVAGTLQTYRVETEKNIKRNAQGSPVCFPKVEKETEVHIVSVYQGFERVDANIKHHPPKYADVTVKETAKPALLYLNAYEPVVWRINIARGASVTAVYINGYHEQLVSGLKAGVPVFRSSYSNRSRKRIRCVSSNEPQNSVSKQDQNVADWQQLRLELRALHAKSKKLREKMRVVVVERKVLSEIAQRLEEGGADQTGLNIVLKQQDLSIDEFEELETQSRQLIDDIRMLNERQLKLRPIKRGILRSKLVSQSGFARYRGIRSAEALISVKKLLAEIGPLEIESYQYSYAAGARSFVIDGEQGLKYRAAKALGQKIMSQLKEPKLLRLQGKLLALPKDLAGRDGLKFLVSKGYLELGGPAVNYYCKKAEAFRLAQGIQGKGKCNLESGYAARSTYTVLGPIEFPAGLCGGHSVAFLIPSGTPLPVGNACHSRVIRLSDMPCTESQGSCHMRQMKK